MPIPARVSGDRVRRLVTACHAAATLCVPAARAEPETVTSTVVEAERVRVPDAMERAPLAEGTRPRRPEPTAGLPSTCTPARYKASTRFRATH